MKARYLFADYCSLFGSQGAVAHSHVIASEAKQPSAAAPFWIASSLRSSQ
jgi:hypothetical protein